MTEVACSQSWASSMEPGTSHASKVMMLVWALYFAKELKRGWVLNDLDLIEKEGLIDQLWFLKRGEFIAYHE